MSTLIYVTTNNVKIIDNYFKIDSIVVQPVIYVTNATSGVEIIDNVLSKSSSNTSAAIGYSNSSPSAVTIAANIGF